MQTLRFVVFLIAITILQCNAKTKTDFSIYLDSSKPEILWNLVLPGTKWCGDGDNAEDYDDLGVFKETDMCCREHDHCDDYIEANSEKYGLVNEGLFTRLHCKCDSKFFKCLKTAKHQMSDVVGALYFMGLGGQCYDEKHPATCVAYEIISFKKRCTKYEYDQTKPKVWQWFDAVKY